MPSSGWLSAIARQFTRVSSKSSSRAHSQEDGDANNPRDGSSYSNTRGVPPTPPSRSTTPWNLESLDVEIAHQQGRRAAERPESAKSAPILFSDNYNPHPVGLSRSVSYGESGLLRMIAQDSEGQPSSPRPSSAASRLSAPAQPLLRTNVDASTSVDTPSTSTPLPAQVDDSEEFPGEASTSTATERPVEDGKYFIPPDINPLYERSQARPTPTSSRCDTPIWELDGEKRVRFLEPEVVGKPPSRPSSGNSQYTNVLKNSTRFNFQPSQDILEPHLQHNPRYCTCPCHFLPMGKRSIGIQAKVTTPLRLPRHYRLMVIPKTTGLEGFSWSAKSLTLATRVILSQVGLAFLVVVWWIVGAIIFSTLEGPLESHTITKMRDLRSDLVIELATELRQVIPYEAVWRGKIDIYMGRLEAAVLEASRAGYGSRVPAWTMSGSFLYAASLTSLLGTGGMVLRAGFSRIFAVVFTCIGCPLLMLFALSTAHTVREGVAWVWAWRKRRRQVHDPRPDQYESTRGSSAISTLNLATDRPLTPPPSPAPNGPSAVPQSWNQATQPQPKVPSMDDTLAGSRPSSSSATSSPEDATQGNGSTAVPSSSTQIPNNNNNHNAYTTNTDNLVTPQQRLRNQQQIIQHHHQQQMKRNKPPPCSIFFILLFLHLLLGLAIFIPVQRWSFPSALYILGCNLLTLDHGGLGERRLINSPAIVVLYVLYLTLGVIILASVILTSWPRLSTVVSNTGKYLEVVRPVQLPR